ncbi:uncharacterized protein CLUP02_02938 [Colletotrichum lupini]|uniref:Uncharacterized protein n=1 Tax=Colletotrichum lupini TaxID=145971 RepID=A0A9Q8SIA0_9PEZI|nr:uncharacterized protein CLUP02_02938 [Colletotrichum lupini]UQC77470.1 hypothetical protein CLUP02_02938 [Colletotrichum lupini]
MPYWLHGFVTFFMQRFSCYSIRNSKKVDIWGHFMSAN